MTTPHIDVPNNKEQATKLLMDLYNEGHDQFISNSFEQFSAVLDVSDIALIHVYMSEINLGINGQAFSKKRIQEAIQIMQELVDDPRYGEESLLYSMANGWLVLGEYEPARKTYQRSGSS